MRFDDALDTVLATEMSTAAGVQAVWRQLVDLIGRRRAMPSGAAIGRLRAIRGDIPPPVRAASARALEFANPPASLVRLFAEDDLAIAAPVLRSARLRSDEWIEMLPAMPPTSRSLLRNRRDLSPEVLRALESFGPSDFVLPAAVIEPAAVVEEPAADVGTLCQVEDPVEQMPVQAAIEIPERASEAELETAGAIGEPTTPEPVEAAEPIALPEPAESAEEFQAAEPSIVIEEAEIGPESEVAAPAAVADVIPFPQPNAEAGSFEISDLVARIDAYQRAREEQPTLPFAPDELHAGTAQAFRFETDAKGVLRWVAGAAREPLIGLSLDLAAGPGARSGADGVAGGAFRRRAPFIDARLRIEGQSDAAGDWRISGTPAFERASGRFLGYRGEGRRPRIDEQPELARRGSPQTDSLRQLVHELRTPTNAIAGFAEMIEGQLLGPVPPVYREQAATIRDQARDLIGAIDDIDVAARIDAGALSLRATRVPLPPILARLSQELRPLADLRGAKMTVIAASDLVAEGDERTIERLLSRLMATLLTASARDEQISLRAGRDGRETIAILMQRPSGLPPGCEAGDAEAEATAPGGPLLGTGFALRLAQNLARELGGVLEMGVERLTLRLPAAVDRQVDQAAN